MRIIRKLQLFFQPQRVETELGAEIKEIDRILSQADGIEELYQEVLSEVTSGKNQKLGAGGLSAEQIIKLKFLYIIVAALHGPATSGIFALLTQFIISL